jgi:hypothetical protein
MTTNGRNRRALVDVNGIQHSYPGKDFDNLMSGVDAVLAKGYIDERNSTGH